MSELIFVAGLLHFGILLASALVPQVLDWQGELARLSPLSRRLVWVHGGYVVFMIVGLGAVAVGQADALSAGTPLARAVCGFIALFWGVRLCLQYGVLDATGHLDQWFLKFGYHGLTLVFVYHAVVYAFAAFLPV